MGHSWSRKQGQPRERKSLLGRSKNKGLPRARLVPDNAAGKETRQEEQFERLRDVPTMPPDFEDRE